MSLGGVGSAISKVVSFTILGLLFKEKKQKDNIQRIGELSEQTAKEGEPRPIIWGRVRPISGNIMHSSRPRIVTREVQGQSSGGGKGGSKKDPPKQYEERVFRTYAIRICEGPITAIIRVWRNNKLVYDGRGNAWGAKNNRVFTKRARFYLGGWSQMPDPTLESVWGAGNVPGYRGTCYMVVPDEDLTDLGGAIPQYVFEVERAEGVALTSKPYALEGFDSAESARASTRASPEYLLAESVDSVTASVTGGDFISSRKSYDSWPAEKTDAKSASIPSGELRSMVIRYDKYIAESLESSHASAVSGELKRTVIKYDNYPADAAKASQASITGGVF